MILHGLLLLWIRSKIMKLIIAEKPDQGMTLASIFKTKKSQGYLEILPNDLFPDGGFVTWAIGHICQLEKVDT